MGSRARQVFWTVVGYSLVLGAGPLIFLAPMGTILAACVIAGVMGGCLAREGLASRRWTRVPGRITRSEIAERVSQVDAMTNVRAEIQYAYEVDGRTYQGDRMGSGKLSSEARGLAERRLKRYPVGAEVQVYVRPENPGEALLEPSIPAVAWLLLGSWIFAPVAVWQWFVRYGENPGRGWLDALPLATTLLVAAISRFVR